MNSSNRCNRRVPSRVAQSIEKHGSAHIAAFSNQQAEVARLREEAAVLREQMQMLLQVVETYVRRSI
jgi:hypothetical protein